MADNTTAAPAAAADPGDTVAQLVASVARGLGIPPEVALAIAYQESRLDPQAEGDRGYFHGSTFVADPSGPPTSFGLYQLHEHGELGNLSVSAAENAYTNASVALPHIAAARKKYPHATWGQIAAIAQGPADKQRYAADVDTILTNYRLSKLDPVTYFGKVSKHANDPQPTTNGPSYAPGADPQTMVAGPSTGNTGPVNDWISALDGILNPGGFSLNPLNDTASIIKLVFARGALAGVGLVMVGTGLLLMFGREIFGAAVLAVPGGAEAATAVRGARKAARGVTAPIR